MPTISMIAAMANNRIIGANNTMPWHLPADLKHFKSVTMGKPIIMGRKTYESIGRALPGRLNIVISRSGFEASDATVVDSVDAALAAVRDVDEVMIIGGGAIYDLLLPTCHKLYLTFIDLSVEGDTQFPDWQVSGNWEMLASEKHTSDDKNPHDYEFVTLVRAC